ncbi:MAG: LacI family transcriptional regulator [Actinobacteria bacterium]|nr:LacI family transcriptional regulator [Actinomycetota bacterium]
MEKITIYEIATKAGVSPKTVSRVINSEPSVSKATYEKVLKIIKETNFLPNISAQRLVSNKLKAIGLIVPRLGSPYASELISMILSKCKAKGYISVVYPVESDKKESEKILALYLQRHIDGYIFAPPGGDDEFLLNYLGKNNIPTILITPNSPYRDFCVVKATDKMGGYQATNYLISLGHKKIGIITCIPSRTFARERLEGYKEALAAHGIQLNERFILLGDNSFSSGFLATKELMSLVNPPTAIFACNDEMALGAESAIYKMGLKIPENISLIGFDDIPLVSELSVPLTTIKQPVEDIGSIAVSLLIQLIEKKEVVKKVYEIPTELVIRNSCKKIV